MKFLSVIISATLLLLSNSAAAASPSGDLVEHTPSGAKVLIGINVPAIRSSFLFADVVDFLEKQQAGTEVLGFITHGGFVDLKKDVNGILIATPATEMPKAGQPAPKPEVAVILDAKFEEKEVIAAARSKYGEVEEIKRGKRSVWKTPNFRFAFIGKNKLGLVTGGAEFEGASLDSFADSKKSLARDEKTKSLMGRISTKSGLWMTSATPPTAPGMQSTPFKDVAMAVDLAPGIQLEVRGDMRTEEDATKMKAQLDLLKKDQKQRQMLELVGAGPLLDNLSIKAKATRLDLTTRMSASQFKALYERLKALQGAQGGQAFPGMQGMQPGVQPPAAGSGADKAPAKTPKSGAEADFN